MSPSDSNLADITQQIHALLVDLDSEKRQRVIASVCLLLGEQAPGGGYAVPGVQQVPPQVPAQPAAPTLVGAAAPMPDEADAQAFFDQKAPQNKGEQLAVAARFLEISEGLEKYKKEDFKRVFDSARRNFDRAHFSRDLDNAKRQAGFFTMGSGSQSHSLSHYGQQYVDALPDRAAVAALRRPRLGPRKKKAAAKRKKS